LIIIRLIAFVFLRFLSVSLFNGQIKLIFRKEYYVFIGDKIVRQTSFGTFVFVVIFYMVYFINNNSKSVFISEILPLIFDIAVVFVIFLYFKLYMPQMSDDFHKNDG
jgi:hypothetical protein